MEFIKAKPIWLEGLSGEMNIQAGFKAKLKKEQGKSYKICITAATLYRMYINGEFVCYGPARAAHGYGRVDVVDITDRLDRDENIIAVEVAGYYCGTYYNVKQTSFLCAEIVADEEVVAATGYDFNGIRLYERVQKCHRFSFQRSFTDIWELKRDDVRYLWKTEDIPFDPTQLVDVDVKFLDRHAVMPKFNVAGEAKYIESGILEPCEMRNGVMNERYIVPSQFFECFPDEEIEKKPLVTDISTKKMKVETLDTYGEAVIKEGGYVILDLSRNYSGFVKTQIVANKDSDIMIVMDEVLNKEGVPDPIGKMSANQIMGYYLAESINTYDLESFEAYGFRYALVAVTKGEILLKNFCVREYAYPLHNLPNINISDERLKKIYDASVETFRQNVVDVYMDCPTRERAGWLCDSYFMSQSEYFYTGDCNVERDFVDNYAKYTARWNIPQGMVPMCYPAEHANSDFIPQWSMWLLLEIEQYLTRDKNADKENYRNLCYGILDFFKKYENADGLAERIPGWNFVEWSKANSWVRDINYPTNMMYARIMEIVGTIYGDSTLIEKCEALRKVIIEKSFDGQLFVDNAIYNEDGIAVNTENHSETCQYYAFMFGLVKDINDPKYSYIKELVLNVFGPDRGEKGIMPEIEPSNAFMGIYIRMELLYKWGMYEKLLDEIVGFFGKMADLTGTLWEHNRVCASLNHGFASYAGVMIAKALEALEK